MAKLNQIIAVVTGKKTKVEKEFGDLNKVLQKMELFTGISRSYQPLKDDDTEKLPSENKLPQKNARDIIVQTREILTGIVDAIATQEFGNCEAKADVVVDGETVLKEIPVTVLLYLEKQLTDLHTFVGNMPTLDPAERWILNEQTGQYQTDVVTTLRSKKVKKALVLYPATDKHPAQTQMIEEDEPTGNWNTTKFSTAVSAVEKKAILARITKLQDAVKIAREEANSIVVEQKYIAEPLLNFVFGK